jgi:cohesin domain-containing protein
MRISTLFFIVAIFLTGLTASNASAAAITLNSSGASSYQLVGSGLSNLAALDVTIRYDASTLESPTVTSGTLTGGAVFVSNPNIPGEVRIAFIQQTGISGNGVLANIAFTLKGSSGGRINGISLNKALDPKSATLQIPTSLGNVAVASLPTEPGSGAPPAGQGGTTTIIPGTQPSGTGGIALGGTVTLPGEGSNKEKQAGAPESQEAPPVTAPVAEIARQEPVPESTPPVKKEKQPIPSPPANVLELFRTYKGEPVLKEMKKLFAGRGGEWIVQNPPVAPADGNTLITLQLATDIFGEKAPNFSLKGVEMKGVVPTESGWAIQVVPSKDVLNSSISILFEGKVVEVQVVAVPPLPKAWDKVTLTETEANRYLSDRKSSKGDLNGDGNHDYKDDYILVGNYLLKETAAQPKKTVGSKEAK